MSSLLWLADALRSGGVPVWEDPQWKQRGHGAMGQIRGVCGHHTAGGGPNDWLVVRNGRPGLAGPLAQLTVERDGTWRVLASGQAWHAGSGGPWLDVPAGSGNTHLIGIEGVSSGRVPGDWTSAQLASYPRGVAALLRHLQFRTDRFLFHKTWAPARKIDIAGWPGDLSGFRADVARWMTAPTPEVDVDAAQDLRLRRVERAVEVLVQQICGARSTIENPWPVDKAGRGIAGWSTTRYGVAAQEQRTPVQLLTDIDRQLNSALDLTGRPERDLDNDWGHLLSLRAEVRAVAEKLDQILAAAPPPS